jgi:predicted dithiol-disulfide oxidoreductase (DUF899 family)/DNA gyrase inhibitor GyrI
MKPIQTPISGHKAVSSDEWLEARKAFLAKEKEFTRLRDELSRERRELPWIAVEKDYVFDAPEGKRTLAELFAGKSQLMVYHFMLGPGWAAGCASCSYLSDHFDGMLAHLRARDVTLAVVSRAPLPEIEAFKKRMGWDFKWLSSYESDFNFDYGVSFTKDELARGKVYYNYEMGEFGSEEAPGLSVFYKDENGSVFHTYSSYARGLDILVGTYNFLDLAPKGRDEEGLSFTMAWVRHHDRYGDDYQVDPTAKYQQPQAAPNSPEFTVEIKTIEPIRVAFMRHVGPYPECGVTWAKLMPALAKRSISTGDSLIIGIGHDNPAVTPEAELRYDACVAVGEDFQADGEVAVQTIPGGEYAVATYVGSYDRLADVYGAFFGQWLPQSGRQMGAGPCFEVYGGDPTKTAPADPVTRIHAPVRGSDSNAGRRAEQS